MPIVVCSVWFQIGLLREYLNKKILRRRHGQTYENKSSFSKVSKTKATVIKNSFLSIQ